MTNLPYQFQFTDKAETQILQWAVENEIQLVKVEYVVPFVLEDKDLEVWLFLDTDIRFMNYKNNGTSKKIETEFLRILKSLDYESQYLDAVNFHFDTKENIDKDYKGSYYNRLR
jgi:hypothetical protein